MSFAVVAAGVGVASAGYGVYKGIKQDNEANAIKKGNPRPDYTIPDEYKQNVEMARQMAQIGLPQQQYNNQVNAINQNQAGAVAALSNSNNPGANLASVVRAGNTATGNLNAQDASARQGNQRLFLNENSQLGQQNLAAQQYNKFDKYTENFNQAAALQGAANQNIQNGVNGIAQLGGDAYMAKNAGLLGWGQPKPGTMSLPAGTAQQMQVPQKYWSTLGMGSGASESQFNPNQFNFGAQWGQVTPPKYINPYFPDNG